MAQTIQILRTTTNTPPPTLLPGALSAELGTQTKLWIGAAGGNRLLLSSDPVDVQLNAGAIIAPAAPNAMPGSLWWDSNVGQLYVRYNDGNSTAWVAASTGSSLAIPVAVAQGGTGATTAPQALTNLGAVAKTGDTISGNLYVAGELQVDGSSYLTGPVRCDTSLTLLVDAAVKPGGGTWAAPSDRDLKENIVQYDRGLDAVIHLNPVIYSYNGKANLKADGKRYAGLIADEVKPVMPEMLSSATWHLNPAVMGTPEDETIEISTLDTGPLLYALINAIKELNAKVEALAPAAPAARR